MIFVIAVGCEKEEVACQVDADCAPGFICRDQVCGDLRGDAAAVVDSALPPPTCSAEGTSCATVDDCCSRTCTDGRCASATPPTTPTCRGLSELCRDDCCSGLTCVSGICR